MKSVANRLTSGSESSKSSSITTITTSTKEIFDLATHFAEILGEVDRIIVRVDVGNGMSPLTRRISILRKKNANNHLFAFFLAVHTRRGANWRLYANQSNELQSEYRNAADFFGISTSSGDKGVTSQVIANAFGDLMQAYRKDHPLKIGDATLPSTIPVAARYQWVGSLGSMYIPGEESSPIESWLKKTVSYIHFMYWYVEATGKLTGKERKKGQATIAERVLKGCHFAWQSWSAETRKSWFENDFSAEPKSGETRYAPLDATSIAELISENKWD